MTSPQSVPTPQPRVAAVHSAAERPAHGFAKPERPRVVLVPDHGVAGDLHAGTRARRQVHLVDRARYDLLRAQGHDVAPGYLGENVTTTGLDLLGLGRGAVLSVGGAVVVVTGMRFPRHDDPTTDRLGLSLDDDGVPVGRVGVFATVREGGEVQAGDPVAVLDPGHGALSPE